MPTPNEDSMICANTECAKDLRTVNPVYGIEHKPTTFCSRACRSTLTGENPMLAAPPKPAPVAATASAATAPEKGKGKKVAPAPSKGAPASAPRGATAFDVKRTPKAALTGKLHILDNTRKYSGVRAQVWGEVKEGITVEKFLENCAKKGLDGKGNLRVFVTAFKCVEVK